MTIEEIKKYMKEHKITYQNLSDMSNIPVTTLKDIFRGAIKNPRIDTYNAIEEALGLKEKTTDKVAKIIRDLQDAGLTEERYNEMTEEQRQDFLQLVKIMTKKKK
ncbi:MAG: helix-turn-helix domain-containing protein [Clostridia bacterium]|nr:helix-turn-helix domain-containing protein [Clostridia bacterium]